MNQSELEANTCSRRQARENACEQVTIGFGFSSDWLRKCAKFFSQWQSVAVQNQSNREITFDTQMKTESLFKKIPHDFLSLKQDCTILAKMLFKFCFKTIMAFYFFENKQYLRT